MTAASLALIGATIVLASFISGVFGMAGGMVLLGVLLVYFDVATAMVLFSILEPGTHIVPHCGMLNTRLICHLPLIVPTGCRLRVGNHSRDVEAGKMLIFDDSIEHEAWNSGDAIRVILLFEIWRPELTAAERAGLTALYESVSAYDAE